MNQSAFYRFVARVRSFRKSRDDRIHYGAALAGPQRMTWNATGFVDHDQRGILEENLKRNVGIRRDSLQRGSRFDLDIVARMHHRAFDPAPSVEPHCAASDHLTRLAPRGRMPRA